MPECQQITPSYWKPVQHSMTRRQASNNYHVGHKAYMVTLRIEGMARLLGSIVAASNNQTADCYSALRCGTQADSATVCDQQRVAVSVALSPLGQAMRTAWLTLPQRFHNITVVDAPDEYTIMPEHFHGIIYVTGYMQEHLGDIITLFKARVAMAYRQMLMAGTVQPVGTGVQWLQAYCAQPATQQQAMQQWVERQMALLYSATRCGTQGDSAPFKVTASGQRTKQGFLFATGYTDSMLLDDDNLDGHRQYIHDNPYNRWLRTTNSLRPNRNGIDTAVSFNALVGYLRRECSPRDIMPEKLQQVHDRLLFSATGSRIECHTYGNRACCRAACCP